jgi:hypothetical protein
MSQPFDSQLSDKNRKKFFNDIIEVFHNQVLLAESLKDKNPFNNHVETSLIVIFGVKITEQIQNLYKSYL